MLVIGNFNRLEIDVVDRLDVVVNGLRVMKNSMISNMVDGLGVVVNLVLRRMMIIGNLHGFGVINRFSMMNGLGVINRLGFLVSRGFMFVRLSFIRLDLSFVLDISDEAGVSIDVVSHHKAATIGKIDEVASLGAVPFTALFSSVVVVFVLDGVVVLVASRSLHIQKNCNEC